MPEEPIQRLLDGGQIAAFYHDLFVKSQVKDFTEICVPKIDRSRVVSDMGGGFGYFAHALARDVGLQVRVVDADPVSVKAASLAGLDAIVGNALEWKPKGDESVACFNLILHHLVGANASETESLQMCALERWKRTGVLIFVNEYIYDSYVSDISGALIYHVTSSRVLSAIASLVAKFVPSLHANTLGVGVRFRAEREWRRLFSQNGWRLIDSTRGQEEFVSWPLRMLLIKSCRRDSFLLSE